MIFMIFHHDYADYDKGDDAMLMMTNSGWWRESQDMTDIITR